MASKRKQVVWSVQSMTRKEKRKAPDSRAVSRAVGGGWGSRAVRSVRSRSAGGRGVTNGGYNFLRDHQYGAWGRKVGALRQLTQGRIREQSRMKSGRGRRKAEARNRIPPKVLKWGTRNSAMCARWWRRLTTQSRAQKVDTGGGRRSLRGTFARMLQRSKGLRT